MKKIYFCSMLLGWITIAPAQPKASLHLQDTSYTFTEIKTLPGTPIRNQAKSGTCWCFSGIAMLESDLVHKYPNIDLSEMWIVRNIYREKVLRYVRMHQTTTLSPGGVPDDVVWTIDRYGIVPESAYTGLTNGATQYDQFAMDKELKHYADSIITAGTPALMDHWMEGVEAILDRNLGPRPTTFTYEGKRYTPKEFAQMLGIRADNYVVLSSFEYQPYYSWMVLDVPDNWNATRVANIPLEELQKTIAHSISMGHAVNWSADISEPLFRFRKEGYAVVPVLNRSEITPSDTALWRTLSDTQIAQRRADHRGLLPEVEVTPQRRQHDFDIYEITDDHGMLLMGTATDQLGRPYYKVKNSWGKYGPYQGYGYASEPYVLYKTTAVMVRRDMLSKELSQRLGLR